MNSFRTQYIIIKMEDEYFDLIEKQLKTARGKDRNNKPIDDYELSKVEGVDSKVGA